MQLTDGEDLRNTVLNAPIGICILDADTLVAEIVNDKFVEVAGRPYEAIYNKFHWDVFAEVRVYYEAALAAVVKTGEPYYANEAEMVLIRHGREETVFVTFVYSPVKDVAGKVKKIAIWVLENTIQVAERQKVEASRAAFQRERDKLKEFFMQAPAGICILDGPNLVFEMVNPAYQELLPGRQLLGRSIFKALPELIGTPVQGSLLKVYNTGQPFEIKESLVAVAEYEGGPTHDRYFSFNFQARRDENDKIDGIINFVFEVTGLITTQHELTEARDQAEQQRRVYETIASGTPDLMYVFGLDYRFTYVNEALLSMWGKTLENAVGKSLLENGYEPWHAEMHEREIDHIIATKESVRGEVAFPHATLGRRVYDYILIPVLDANGEVEAVAGTTRDVTERNLWEMKLAESSEQLQVTNEELAATNEESAVVNEELTSANEALMLIQQELQSETEEKQLAIDRLKVNEQNIRNMVRQAPVGMCIIEGDPLYVVETNDSFLELIGKTREALQSTPYWEVNAEAAPYYEPITKEVLATGQTYHAKEHEIMLIRNGVEEIVIVDFVYEPMKDIEGKTYAIMIVAIDVTDKVTHRKKVERAEESLRMAIEAANLGTYFINVIDRKFYPSAKLKEFFGYAPDEEVPYEAALNQIHPDYRQGVADRVEAAITRGAPYDTEYPIIAHNDGRMRWVRAIGTVQQDDNGINRYFTGVLHEITEQKQDEIRKNDFIGMVSHELKTPLTSLAAIIQMSNLKLKNSEDAFLVGAMGKANIQVKRMTAMINGFLNISRLESGKILIEKQAFDMDELLREMIDESRMTVITHRIELDSCGQVEIYADRDKISSVISNLVGNAVKYSPKGKVITVKCLVKGHSVEVTVADEGIGIKLADLEKVFDRYYRVETSNTQHISGFGIGLYLSAEIIQRHDGKIWAESEPGVGSTFYFSLPLK